MSVNSKKWHLTIKDWGKALLMAVLSGVIGAVTPVLLPANFLDIKQGIRLILASAFIGAVSGFLGYIGKQLGTTSDGKFLGTERRKE